MNGDVNSLFIDTNILVYSSIRSSPLHSVARQRLVEYQAAGIELRLSRQVLREYLAVVTRPQIFAQPLSMKATVADVRVFQQKFRIADDNRDVGQRLTELLESVVVAGKQIHDTNIVATMKAYGVTTLLTHNWDDFKRFSNHINILTLEE
ncbi:PIN domain-containing protein [bacterium]|nr:PIN domain-containing protein [bacterium]